MNNDMENDMISDGVKRPQQPKEILFPDKKRDCQELLGKQTIKEPSIKTSKLKAVSRVQGLSFCQHENYNTLLLSTQLLSTLIAKNFFANN